VVEFLEWIQGTLDPYSVVMLEFPGADEARAWYESPGYQAILPLRTDNIDGDTIIVDGVEVGYDPAKLATATRPLDTG
jgi:uncharacterized protein (DUF1330 family)